jgi:hypothetical protein
VGRGDFETAEQDFAAFVARKLAESKRRTETLVPKTHLWAVTEDQFVGRISIHHELNNVNKVEVIVAGSEKAVHIINGHTVFEATNLRQLGADNKNWGPLTKGRISLQAEFAEVFYRNIEIRPIPEGPLHPAVAR